MKTFKYRIYPNKEQVEKLIWTLGRCRELYNAALQERRDIWNVVKRHPNYYDPEWRKEAAIEHRISYFDQTKQLLAMKKIREEYQDIGAHVLYNVLKRVDLAFSGFFRRVKAGKTPGYPRFQGKARYDSFTYPDKAGWKIEGKRLNLSKIRSIKVKLHRPIEGTIKTTTIKREGTQWYVCFVCEVEMQAKLPYTDEAIGIDLGLLHFATLSTGDTIENPRFYRKGEAKLRAAQESLSRKKRGSNRRRKAVQRVAKAHRKVRNQRNDFLHKQSTQLVQTYETIVFEDLQLANMSKRPKPKQDEEGKFLPNGASAKAGLNKSITDAGWGMFMEMCKSKAESAGINIVFVNPHNTSQICSACLKKGPHKDLSERTHTCIHCGVVLDRDHNAAINILRLGQSHQVAKVA
jgi:putative transposase